jgi:hypothetical protein
LLVQAVTVWYALRASRARPGVRLGAAGVFLLALVAAVINLVSPSGGLVGYTFLAASVLSLIAPVSIIADLARRRDVGREPMLGALATYLMIGMAFAFGYRCLAELGLRETRDGSRAVYGHHPGPGPTVLLQGQHRHADPDRGGGAEGSD